MQRKRIRRISFYVIAGKLFKGMPPINRQVAGELGLRIAPFTA